ncbi:outer membrane protein (porin) [Caballeronia calidae]|uniref:Outer membrane protein (Porin) n=1 Tax=Caballeronia calidae TaxID=1777139 RepID=A0A158E0A3_9BURK|nr:porin [Caballeronia calidae]SAL00258.1 outer membrane protein (porin) [Caballeronia calidae]
MLTKGVSKHALAAAAAMVAAPTFAQSSVTLYGIVDTSITYQNSQTTLGSTTPGKSNIRMQSGVWNGSRWGLRGTEDLGGGTQVLFVLESGFNLATGGQQFTNAMFGRQSRIEVSNKAYGALSLGRQYSAYYTMLAPWVPALYQTGYGSHPGDLDGLDTYYRANNAIVYTTPTFYGFTASGEFAPAGVPGSLNQGSTWSAGLQYKGGSFGLAAAFWRINNSTPGGGPYGAESSVNSAGQQGVSAITNGYNQAQGQQRFAVDGGYYFNEAWDISFAYSNVQYIPGINSKFTDTAVWNTAGSVLHYMPSPALDLAVGYSYTWASKANNISDAAKYHQVVLSQYYALSKRTGFYALEGYQHASGKTLGNPGTGTIINATPAIGDSFQTTPGASSSMVAVSLGIVSKF